MRLTFLAAFLLIITGCNFYNQRPIVYRELAMSTIAEISLWEDGGIAKIGFDEIRRIEDKFSIFKKDSEITKINNDPSAVVSPECKYLIEESQRYSKITNGAFNISYRHDGKYDLGGIAKGYAVDKAAEIFKQKKVNRAMINLGGNLYLIGYPPGKNFWTVGIKDPKNPDKLIGKLKISNEVGIATSGEYERPGHIIDPETGKSVNPVRKPRPWAGLSNGVNNILGATIVAPTAMEADALSTGVFVLGREKGMELIEKLPGVEGVIVDGSGVYVSSGLKDKYESR